MRLSSGNVPQRRRRVRFAYPQAVVDLVLALIPHCRVSLIADVADIPESVIYRWRDLASQTSTKDEETSMEVLLQRVARVGGVFGRLIDLAARYCSIPQESTIQIGDPLHAGGEVCAKGFSSRASQIAFQKPGVSRTNVRRSSSVVVTDDAFKRLNAARTMIETRYFEAISCSALAETAGMSRTYFIRLFGAAFHLTPHQYLMRVRIQAAKILLNQSHESIDVIAAGVGFRTGANLSRAFRQIEGIAVSQAHAFTKTTTDFVKDRRGD